MHQAAGGTKEHFVVRCSDTFDVIAQLVRIAENAFLHVNLYEAESRGDVSHRTVDADVGNLLAQDAFVLQG